MYIINPPDHLRPSFRISPFRTESLFFDYSLEKENLADKYFDQRFGIGNWTYSLSGRDSLNQVLNLYALTSDKLVTIVTTSGNYYVSSCVTNEIEKYCSWNRDVTHATDLILIIHEFGFPFVDELGIRSKGIPVVEDYCTSFFSGDSNNEVTNNSDYFIYSLSKFFPLQKGGLIVSNKTECKLPSNNVEKSLLDYLRNAMSFYIRGLKSTIYTRRDNYNYGVRLFSELGFSERFESSADSVPLVLLFNNNGVIQDLPKFKKYLTNNGIENSIFYGEDAFFMPCNQAMNNTEFDFFYFLIREYLNEQ
jgi:hypothetical protein